MSEEDSSTSCIKTECVIPNGVILPWILSRFPELAMDAALISITTTFNGGYKFVVEHTVQPTKTAGKIMLEMPHVSPYEHVEPVNPNDES